MKRRLVFLILTAMLAAILFPAYGQEASALLLEESLKYRDITDRANQNATIVPQQQRLKELGYLGDHDPASPSRDAKYVRGITPSHFAAMYFFAQVMGLPAEYHTITPLQQAALYSALAKESPAPVMYAEDYQSLSSGKAKAGDRVYLTGTILSAVQTNGTYTITLALEGPCLRASLHYEKPARAPDLLSGDQVFAFGAVTAVSEDKTTISLDAALVAFAE